MGQQIVWKVLVSVFSPTWIRLFLPLSSFCVEWVYWDDFFPLCCQIEAECQEGCLGVCIWLCVWGLYRGGSACALFVCASYQGSSPSLNKPFVYLGCSLLWAGCPPGCCLSALFESLIKAHLSLSTLSLHPLFHSFNHFPVICSCSLQMFLLYFSFYALAKLSSLCHLVISSFTLFSIPHPWHCLPVPFSLPSAFPLPPSC